MSQDATITQDAPDEKPVLPVNREAASDFRAAVGPGKGIEEAKRDIAELIDLLNAGIAENWRTAKIPTLAQRNKATLLGIELRAKWGIK